MGPGALSAAREHEYRIRNKFDLEKLNGTNYGAWKFKARLYLIHKGLWGVIEGNEVNESKDEKALAIIGLSITTTKLCI